MFSQLSAAFHTEAHSTPVVFFCLCQKMSNIYKKDKIESVLNYNHNTYLAQSLEWI